MPSLGTIITAVVTPFSARDGSVDEQAFVDLLEHLHEHGSDGVAVCGTTGEASTLSDEEHLRMIELAVAERPAGMTVIAGAGSNDTRHAARLTAGACERGADAILSVNPYYNRPNRRGVIAHFREVDRASDRPIILYNIPQRTCSDMPNDLLAELAQLDHVEGVKQANNDNLAPVDGLDLYAGNDDVFGRVLDMGGAGGILVASHIRLHHDHLGIWDGIHRNRTGKKIAMRMAATKENRRLRPALEERIRAAVAETRMAAAESIRSERRHAGGDARRRRRTPPKPE